MTHDFPLPPPARTGSGRQRVAVIGSGISGLAAAWLLARSADVVLYEKDDRLGGHINTVDVVGPAGPLAVDTGFIVFNTATYPNLTALLDHLGLESRATDMSFSVSADGGRFEYCGSTSPRTLFAQPSNLLRPRFWSMLRDLVRFYREAPSLLDRPGAEDMTLAEYLAAGGYGRPFIDDHLVPMGAAIWSAAPGAFLDHPAKAFIRFCHNHGLLLLKGRPRWRTVVGGSRRTVQAMMADFPGRVRLGTPVRALKRLAERVVVVDALDTAEVFDEVVIATHADQALALLGADADAEERRLLAAVPYQPNTAYLHRDAGLMPRRRRAWASWNYLAESGGAVGAPAAVTYWMNQLQGLPEADPLFVSLNPPRPPAEGTVLRTFRYDHPVFGPGAPDAQRALWSLQGRRRTWFCGAWFGAGFHEDGLQAGLAVAEALGGVRRPWSVPDESGRIPVPPRGVAA
ncbi:NAD(P)/FAD-dependent oxidoreductase [Novispirillum sp. DQ9]|uniref:NAD(P)/FAD-dependent oxidoreductase n=1 Tax=Novispirillum sp. DQ9 TaxID=3398612 RepID=UPI003C7C2ADB